MGKQENGCLIHTNKNGFQSERSLWTKRMRGTSTGLPPNYEIIVFMRKYTTTPSSWDNGTINLRQLRMVRMEEAKSGKIQLIRLPARVHELLTFGRITPKRNQFMTLFCGRSLRCLCQSLIIHRIGQRRVMRSRRNSLLQRLSFRTRGFV